MLSSKRDRNDVLGGDAHAQHRNRQPATIDKALRADTRCPQGPVRIIAPVDGSPTGNVRIIPEIPRRFIFCPPPIEYDALAGQYRVMRASLPRRYACNAKAHVTDKTVIVREVPKIEFPRLVPIPSAFGKLSHTPVVSTFHTSCREKSLTSKLGGARVLRQTDYLDSL